MGPGSQAPGSCPSSSSCQVSAWMCPCTLAPESSRMLRGKVVSESLRHLQPQPSKGGGRPEARGVECGGLCSRTDVVVTCCWQLWASYLTFCASCAFKMGIIISPPHRVTARCELQSHRAAEHSSVSGPAFGCQPVPYNQLNTGAHLPEQARPFPRGRALEGPSPADRSPASCPCTTLLGLGSQRLWVCLSGGIPEQNWEILNRGGTVLLALSSQSTWSPRLGQAQDTAPSSWAFLLWPLLLLK